MPLQITHIAASDIVGGAAIAAYRQHVGLRDLGVRSKMLVLRKQSDDPDVTAVTSHVSLAARLRRRIDNRRQAAALQIHSKTISPKLELFSDDRVAGPNPLRNIHWAADAVNLHWVPGLVDHGRFFALYPQNKPLVWTLHDMNPFTGGCHYSLGCRKFTAQCGACPQLGSNDPRDISSKILRRKRNAMRSRRTENTRIVATSEWMAEQARRSDLFGRFQVDIIPCGLDLEAFKPDEKGRARAALNLPKDRKVVLFVADQVANDRKGFDLLIKAFSGLEKRHLAILVSIGGQPVAYDLPFETISLGRIDEQKTLALAYSAADLFVTPTRAEAFGQVVIESMACGTPVVAFEVGGVPDLVRNGVTGLLAPPEDAIELRQCIEHLLDDNDLRARMGIECRRVVESEYGLELQAKLYRQLYVELIGASANFLKKGGNALS